MFTLVDEKKITRMLWIKPSALLDVAAVNIFISRASWCEIVTVTVTGHLISPILMMIRCDQSSWSL